MRGFTRAVPAALVLLGLLLTACGGGGSDESTERGEDNTSVTLAAPSGEPQRGGRMVYGLIAETDGWHPGQSRWAASGTEVAKSFYDTLSAYDENLEIQPFLAEAFEPERARLRKMLGRDTLPWEAATVPAAE